MKTVSLKKPRIPQTNGDGKAAVTSRVKYQRVRFDVEGSSSLLCHNPESMGKNPRNEGGRVEAEPMVYLNENKQFVLPAVQFLNALLYAAKGRKIQVIGGRKTTAWSVIASSVSIGEGDEWVVLIDKKTNKPFKDFEIDTRFVVVNKGRIPRSRPMFRNWKCALWLTYDTDRLAPSITDDMHEEAGISSGVGDFRPSTRGWFGRYTISRAK